MSKKRTSTKRKKPGHPGKPVKIPAEFDRAMDTLIHSPPPEKPVEKRKR